MLVNIPDMEHMGMFSSMIFLWFSVCFLCFSYAFPWFSYVFLDDSARFSSVFPMFFSMICLCFLGWFNSPRFSYAFPCCFYVFSYVFSTGLSHQPPTAARWSGSWRPANSSGEKRCQGAVNWWSRTQWRGKPMGKAMGKWRWLPSGNDSYITYIYLYII